MGSVVGPPVAKQLSSLMGGKVTVQGVDYPADAGVRFPIPILSYPILNPTLTKNAGKRRHGLQRRPEDGLANQTSPEAMPADQGRGGGILAGLDGGA